ncbi:myozenin-2 [Coregonus clupeaformis]|uniref:myozenin-2 n=1 Tax=Coregonus clupeaformis TaxID=59861 RepID=UPI001BE012FA|nr:myozenin-2 [Coregonus clupeaformis]XP_041710583.1 myozenin-2 [Coregonus clupeaformis]
MMQSVYDNLSKQRMQQAKALRTEARGGGLNLGKKISVPKDVMMEELNLPSNRGSRMFQERLRRVERFTLENQVHDHYSNGLPEPMPPQTIEEPQGGKENQAYLMPGKHSLITTLQKTVAKKGSPNVIAPGYGGPLKEIPCEKFNLTTRSYCSPWREALGDSDNLLSSLSAQLPQPPQRATLLPANYRCFNRVAMPFGGPQQKSKRVIPVMGLELLDSQRLPGTTLDRMCKRPNFNRAPRGWGHDYSPESTDL